MMPQRTRWEPFRTPVHYLGLPGSLAPPLWREHRAASELRALAARRPPAPAAPTAAAPLLVIPGFASGDGQVRLLRAWLREGGWDARPSGITDGRRCSSRDLALAQQRLDELAAETGQAVTLVGHSRGGMFAKVLAVRNPGTVRALVTLGSPLTDPFGVHLAVRMFTGGMAVATRLGLRDWVRECPFGDCCRDVHEDLLRPMPPGIPFTSIASRSDGIVEWRATQDPAARCVEVDSSHGGMIVNADVWAAVGDALAATPR